MVDGVDNLRHCEKVTVGMKNTIKLVNLLPKGVLLWEGTILVLETHGINWLDGLIHV